MVAAEERFSQPILVRPPVGLAIGAASSRDQAIIVKLAGMNQFAARSPLNSADESRIIEMAWEDRTPFEAIKAQFGLDESAVIDLMRAQLKPSSFRMWRKRMKGRVTKHAALRPPGMNSENRQHARHRIAQR